VARDGGPDADALVRGNTDFACGLYRRLAATDGNLFFSPYSLSAALAMTYGGARGNTEKEMATTLRLPPGQADVHAGFGALGERLRQAEQDGIRLRVANSLWPQQGHPFLADYLALVQQNYGASITALDYAGAGEASRATINAWVVDRTEGKIQNLIGPGVLTALTRLVLVNAIYFKGNWQSQFPAAATKDAPFHVADGKSVPTPMMSRKLGCKYASLPALDVLELPYAGDRVSMVVLLPKAIDGIGAMEASLSAEGLPQWLAALRKQDVQVFLPRFKLACGFSLKDTLAAMGMVEAFDERKANFAGMDGRPDGLSIGAVVHKAFVDVNEEGTEAAAATGVVMVTRAMPAPPPVFRADHPFVFLIRDSVTGSILFAGRLVDPTAAGGE
jgi:serpin B